MIFKKPVPARKQDGYAQKTDQEDILTSEELREIAMEMSWSRGMLLPGCFADGIWHLY